MTLTSNLIQLKDLDIIMVRDCSVQAAILKTEDLILEEREKIDNDLQHYSLEYCFEKYQ